MADISKRYEVIRGVTKMMIELRDTEETLHELLVASEKYYFKPMVEKELIKKGDLMYDLLKGLIGVRKISFQFLTVLRTEMDIPRSGSTTDGGFNVLSSFSKNCAGLWTVFSKCFNLFKLFSTYINLYNRESKNFEVTFGKGSELGDFLLQVKFEIPKKITNLHHGNVHAFDLTSLMILPIQRLPRYKILLNSMVKIFLKNQMLLQKYSAECSKVAGALDLVCYICEYVNNRPKQLRTDGCLKQIIRIKYWIEELMKQEHYEDISGTKKLIKAKKKEIKSLYTKVQEEDYVRKQLDKMFQKVNGLLTELEVKVKKSKNKK